MIWKKCPYYYELEPVMGHCPLAAPQHASEQGNGDVSDGPSDDSNTDNNQVPADVDVSNNSSSSNANSLLDASTSQSQPNCTTQKSTSGSRGQPVQSQSSQPINQLSVRPPSTSQSQKSSCKSTALAPSQLVGLSA